MSHTIESGIGNTPLVKLKNVNNAESVIYAKLELMNPSGSMKDRVALEVLRDGMNSGKISAGDTIIESSSGNMGIALAHLGVYYGLNVIIVTDPNSNPLNRAIMKNYGATVIQVEEKSPTTGWHGARIDRIKEMLVENPHMFWVNQYENPLNPKSHINTMNEILDAFAAMGEELDYMFVSASSCGTLMGCHEAIKARGSKTQLVVMDSEGSILFGKKSGNKVIPGHGSSNLSQLLDANAADKIVMATGKNCVEGCHRLLREQGIMAGGSTGGAYFAATQFIADQDRPVNCAMIVCDRGERYLDTIYNPEWIQRKTNHLQEPSILTMKATN